MADIELVDAPDTGYRCTCPLPIDDAHELELARDCAERERRHQDALGAELPAGDGGASNG